MRRKRGLIAKMVVCTALPWPVYAQKSGTEARDLFFRADRRAPVLGLRCAVWKRNPQGGYAEVGADTTFHANDEVRLKVTSNRGSYLYVVQQGSTGTWSMLFPSAEIDGGRNFVGAGQEYAIPGGAGESFVIDGRPGEERILILLAREPVKELDELAGRHQDGPRENFQDPKEPTTVDNASIERLREQAQTRDLVFTATKDGDRENALYVVNKGTGSGDRVVVDLKLNHQ